jgi:class 3 adenylate cyclase/predicted ATPase/ABC-type transport system involved in cytochrome c biogenesis ATPase subunit
MQREANRGAAMDVRGWLRRLGLDQYEAAFRENEIDDTVLPSLTAEDLKDLGVGSVGHRRKLLDAIAALRAEASAPTSLPDAPPATDKAIKDTAERRQVTVMFSDLVGSTALSTRMDPEDLREIISAYQMCVAETVRRFGGFVARYMGDGVLVYFGYPQAHEDDAERAVRAGLALIDAVAALPAPEPLQVRVGAATGMVVVGDLVGSGEGQEHDIVGETPNLAARLQAIAEPNTVVIAEATRRLLGNLFELRDLGPNDLKGIPGPVRAFAAVWESSVESRFEAMHPGSLTPLVGRAEELELLLRCWTRAKSGEGQVVLLSGEAGIGKSRLTRALLEDLAGEPQSRLRYFCSPQHTDSALHPFIAQIERTAGIKSSDTTTQRLDKLEEVLATDAKTATTAPLIAALLSIPTTGRYPPLKLTPTQQRRQTFAALLDHLESLVRKMPALWIFEDAHWADASSIELIDLAVDRIRHLRVLAIITFRPEFNPPWDGLSNVTTFAIGRLARSDVEDMIAQVTIRRLLSPEVVKQIVDKTDGNPLFVEELTKAVLEGGILAQSGEGYRPLPQLAIPATLRDSLMARLDHLGPVKEIAQLGAAIGREFSYSLLRALARCDDATLWNGLAQLEQAELVFRRGEIPDAIYSFKHALIQDAAYESLLKGRRQTLHRNIAETLCYQFPKAADAQPEVIAHHFSNAGFIEVAAEWWGKAGEFATRRSAYSEAIDHYRKSLKLYAELPDDPHLRLRRLQHQTAYAYALFHGRGTALPETATVFAEARALAASVEEIAARFPAYFGMWAGSFGRADLAPMEEVAKAFLSDVQSLPPSGEIGVAHCMFGVTQWFRGHYATARMHLERAVKAYDRKRDSVLADVFGYDPGVIALARLAAVLWPMGEARQAESIIQQALTLAHQIGHVPSIMVSHHIACILASMRGDAADAESHSVTILDLAREHSVPLRIADSTFFFGWSRWHAGNPNGEAGMREGVMMLCRLRHCLLEPLTQTLLAELEAQCGRTEIGLKLLDEQLAKTHRSGQRWFDSEIHRMRAKLLLLRGPSEIAEVEKALTNAIEVAQAQQTRAFELLATISLARLYQATNRDRAARELLHTLSSQSIGHELPEFEEVQRLGVPLVDNNGITSVSQNAAH